MNQVARQRKKLLRSTNANSNLNANGKNKKSLLHETKIDNEGIQQMTREDLISTLWKKLNNYLCCGENIVHIDQRSTGKIAELYLHSRSTNNMHICVHRPCWSRWCIILSALQGMYLIWDTCWVHDHWQNFGLRQIEKGADLALLDQIDLGQKIGMIKSQMRGRKHLDKYNFFANAIWLHHVKRQVVLFIVFCAILL